MTGDPPIYNCVISHPFDQYKNHPMTPVPGHYQKIDYIDYGAGTSLGGNISISSTHSDWRRAEFDNSVRLSVDLPGVIQRDLEVYVEGSTLCVKYSRVDSGVNLVKKYELGFLHNLLISTCKATFYACILDITFNKKPKEVPEKFIVKVSGE